MKLRYYLRGLGIGILVTALLIGISIGGNKEKLTNEEIKARAKALGMIENTTISALTEKQQETMLEESKAEESKAEESKVEETKLDESVPDESIPDEPISNETVPEEAPIQEVEQEEPSEMITIVVKSGDSSVSVSKALEAVGLVLDAKAYDRYLCTNGYDKKISVGTYKIPSGCTDEEIAKVITKKLSFE